MTACLGCGAELIGGHPNQRRCATCARSKLRDNRRRYVARLKAEKIAAAACIDCGAKLGAIRFQRCASCQKLHLLTDRRENYAKNPEKYRERANANNQANPERNRAKAAAWAKANPIRHKAQAAKWKMLNQDRARALVARWHAAHPDRVKELSRAFSARHPEASALNKQRRRARLIDACSPGVSRIDWAQICEQYQNRCAYCFAATKPTIDHFVPIARGGKDEPSNVLPACARCNQSKGARSFIVWFAARGHEFMERRA